MAEQDKPEQDEAAQPDPMQRMVDLAEERTTLAHERTVMAADRSRMSADRSRMSGERSRMSADRSRMSADRSRMSADRSRMSADRSEMSAERSYMAAERTLSVWIRTALALMVFGVAIDRFGLFLLRGPKAQVALESDAVSMWGGVALVAFGVVMAVATGIRFWAYAATYRSSHRVPTHHGPFLAPLFALISALFGIGLLVLLLVVS